jgi:cytochrome c
MKLSCICVAVALCFCFCREDRSSAEPVTNDTPVKIRDYIKAIPGPSDSIAVKDKQRGEVLVAYSDCYTCHHVEHRAKGPAFKDIAKRYPVNDGYINLLARRIIVGGSGAWGYSVMSPHPDLSQEDAKLMAKFILSLKE